MRLLALFILFFPAVALAQISHLELGAANYSAEITGGARRFQILEETAQDLIKKYGASGTIYLNDIDEGGLNLAVEHLESWLARNGYPKIAVKAVPGNFNEIELPKVKTAHLSNPEQFMLPSYRNRTTNVEVVRKLERLAHQSETGLKITTYFTAGRQDYVSSINEYASTTVLQKISDSGYEYQTPFGGDWRIIYNNVTAQHTSTFVLKGCDTVLLSEVKPATSPGISLEH